MWKIAAFLGIKRAIIFIIFIIIKDDFPVKEFRKSSGGGGRENSFFTFSRRMNWFFFYPNRETYDSISNFIQTIFKKKVFCWSSHANCESRYLFYIIYIYANSYRGIGIIPKIVSSLRISVLPIDSSYFEARKRVEILDFTFFGYWILRLQYFP